MTKYHGNDRVGPGIYFNVRELEFRSVEDEARLPGGADAIWRPVPAVVMLAAAPVLGLAFVMFLPLIGFLMLGWLVVGWVGRQAMPAVLAFGRVLRPAWQPAMAYFGRGKAAAPAAPPRRDPWAEAMREKLDEAKTEEREP